MFLLKGDGGINIKEDNLGYLFFGYPDCNFTKHLSIIFHLWSKSTHFPIRFEHLQGFADETCKEIEKLNYLTE